MTACEGSILVGEFKLELRKLCAGYGSVSILHNLDLCIHAGESVVIVGRNGAGKTTLIETLIGLTAQHSGEILFEGQPIQALAPHSRARLGLGWVPQNREIFSSLTVIENLSIVARPGVWNLSRVLQLFPRLGERLGHYAGRLSGGEQQMLALGRALMTNPSMLLLDEPLNGLSPLIVLEIMHALGAMRTTGNLAILLVEQRYDIAIANSDRYIVIDNGRIVHHNRSESWDGDQVLINRLLGLTE